MSESNTDKFRVFIVRNDYQTLAVGTKYEEVYTPFVRSLVCENHKNGDFFMFEVRYMDKEEFEQYIKNLQYYKEKMERETQAWNDVANKSKSTSNVIHMKFGDQQ